ncbi:MAG: hypothetical protein DI535_04765 [Citrobacter freundii]|nr:MAG: hypothetical protein DI535_04765 [Citrobacter freundii]
MEEVYIKKYWPDENILFYLHFQNGLAVRQIEISSDNKVFLSTEEPRQGDFILFDQSLEDLEVDRKDFITQGAFEAVWAKKQQ